jgi:anti-sigma regulatory factor (Ser/Thr protein kinase)
MTPSARHLAPDPLAVSSTYELPSRPSSARLARRLTRGALGGCPESIVETAELLITELISNAILHASSPPVMHIDVDRGTVRISVSDESGNIPQVRHGELEDEGGRGLMLVQSLASSWGCTLTSGGKQIWFILNGVAV